MFDSSECNLCGLFPFFFGFNFFFFLLCRLPFLSSSVSSANPTMIRRNSIFAFEQSQIISPFSHFHYEGETTVYSIRILFCY